MRFFACDVEFDADVDEIAVSAASADEPLPRASATMARLSDQAAQSYLAALDRDDVVSRVRVAILEQLPEGEPSRREAAARVAVSERTLARRLAAEGTSFKRILNDVRTELAQAYLTEPRRSVTETAFLLGFNDQANFARAFKRWTGQSPTAYRTSHV